LFSKLGSSLVLVGRNESALDETIEKCRQNNGQIKIEKIVGDLTKTDLPEQIVERVLNKFGKINILINSAGIIKAGGLETLKIEDYNHQMNINVTSVVNLTKKCLPYLISAKGSVVNVSSGSGSIH